MSGRHRAPERARRTWSQRVVLALGAVLSIVLLVGAAGLGWGYWKFNQIDRTDVRLADSVATGEPENWLVVGSDSRAKESSKSGVTGQRSDTIMVLRIDPESQKAKALSLPRDLWVTIAGEGRQQRINAAFGFGEQTLIDTIEQNFGIPINHYLEVDFSGFTSMVDSLGGIPMYFDRATRDLGSGFVIMHPGCAHLDGKTALAFARARHLEYMKKGVWRRDGSGDLGRISRQQLLIRKTIDKAVASGLNPLRVKDLVEIGSKNVTIDKGVSAQGLLALGNRFRSFSSGGLKTMTVPGEAYRTDGGASVLKMDAGAAEPILTQFRDANAPTTSSTGTTLNEKSVTLTVLNSSGQQGAAANAAGALRQVGFPIHRWGNGSELGRPSEPTTVVAFAPGSRLGATLVAQHLTTPPALAEDDSLESGQIVLFVGSDFTTVEAGRKPVTSAVAGGSSTTTTTTAPSAATGATEPPRSGTRVVGGTSTPATTSTTVVGHVPGEAPKGVSCE